MLKNKEKAAAIFDLYGMRNDLACKAMHTLIDILIEETRKLNDFVEPSQLPYNQGKISVLSQLKDYMERGLPTPK